MQTKEQRAKRAKLVADARAISDAVKDGETMSAEDSAKFDAIMAEADKLKADIDRIERLDDAEIELKNKIGHRAGRENISEDEAKAKAAVEAAASAADATIATANTSTTTTTTHTTPTRRTHQRAYHR